MKKIKYTIGLFLLFTLTACNDWFEVNPETRVSSDDLYATGDGFRMQVNGMYKNLASESLYARQLTWGFLDVLGQYYIRQNLDNAYQDVNDRLYEKSDVLGTIDLIWSDMYKVIADCNNIIEHVDKASNSIFEFGEPERLKIRGEAFAVRAFVHFDLLRLFAPAPVVNENGTWIPYVTNSESVINNKLTVKQVLENVERDLLEAHASMVAWDSAIIYSDYYNREVIRMWHITERFWKEWDIESEIPEFFGHQRSRMNMASVRALLARLYAYMGEKKKAYDAIEEMIAMGGQWESWGFDDMNWLDPGYGRLLGDVIFNVYNTQAGEINAPFMSAERPLYIRNVPELFPAQNQIDGRFERLLTVLGGNYLSIKSKKGNNDVAYIPLLRKSELYYIKGEYLASVGQVDAAVELLRDIRSARGDISFDDLNTIYDETGYVQAMLTDARKEYIGEGQSFYLFKRLNLPVFDGVQNIDFRNQYVLPVPKSEQVIF
ncbi:MULTISPECIES: RagB/SusD family nutrient uptake outer membrane protein [Odoribacteraceae]|uniref:RagB/SusD family nutrient uptake outer membrane protein n=1 Tax=Odoribacteraceae TaxID=1853231 RepID=UPI000E545257|nr:MULTISPECIES: RagB/SusD family nutrient uptake outer membrane protein [Odoribacteraceae]MCQ4874605.1 RagB/SusD family nutrient uptake outer membrane protein [Butyricimonas paravirosa]RHR76094.1 RagB/SusD family nutrient uptake outer membrane protein [Odoribacter sp. AF15-53]